MIFDLTQRLVATLEPVPGVNYGSVTSLCLSSKWVVAGYEFGHICVFDLLKKQLIKTVMPRKSLDDKDDGHVVGTRVVHVSFVGPKDRFVSADEKVRFSCPVDL